MLKGIRGAARAAANNRGEISKATRRLLRAIMSANRLRADAITAAFFTMTADLTAETPARAARDMGWTHVPMLCSTEPMIDGAMDRVIRALLLVETTRKRESIRHQYLGEAEKLRPDLARRTR
jgi:chorismate mutase